MICVGTILNQRFTLDRELGQGGMGTVYRAIDQVLGRNVAIKLLNDSGTEEVVKKIHLEAQILARFVHDKIVRLYDFAESDGNYFLVMEEVNGPSFSNRWRDLRLNDRLRICGEVAEALDYAHIQGVIHRDVKPGNVLLTSSDEAKLSDFGLSLVTADRKKESGSVRGTPCYMSPEQAQGKSLDHRSDLYSLGVMLYECATGDTPFHGPAAVLIGQHIHTAPMPPQLLNPEISSTLENLILTLLEKVPERRPVSAKAVALALIEEAERMRRLERIGLGFMPSDQRSPMDSSSTRKMSVGLPDAEIDGTERREPAKIESSPSRGSTSDFPRHPDTKGDSPPLPKEPLKSSQTDRAKDSGSSSLLLAREMLTKILATPIVISPEQRYLCGHYLAYLLGGSRRRGIFLRRPLDSRNSDRARLLLAMTWLSCVKPTQEAFDQASQLLKDCPDVRGLLSPVVLVKYLASRDTPAKCKRFRQVRRRLQDASADAIQSMLDANGLLNPGMMPRNFEDLARIAPPLDRLDAHRISLWNRAGEVWHRDADFREAVLRYVTRSANLDLVSADLWPEVVYPLIERTHWQRTFRPRHEALWDYVVGKLLHLPVPGVRLDRLMVIAIPREVADQLEEDLLEFVDNPSLDENDDSNASTEILASHAPRPFYVGGIIPRDEPTGDDDAPRVKVMVPLSPTDPFLFAQNSLRNLWEGAMEAKKNSTRPNLVHQTIPVGPYKLAVIPTARGRSAVRAILQGLHTGKEIEIITPILAKESAPRTMIAIWLYQDGSVVIIHLDFQSKQKHILWHAPNAQQFNFVYAAELKQILSTVCLEIPDQLDHAISHK